ncbi:MAG: PIG-L family deacetylase [Deltaproteobacteria bacterium]|nr:PIG-L family deacetylase [Deltaproteobacteria bacterium]
MQDFPFQRAMIIFAHPDDAEVQCAGTIALWTREGKKVVYVVLTKGDKGTQNPDMDGDTLFKIRKEEQMRAAEELEVEKVIFVGHRDGELEVTMERRGALTRILREHQPEVLVTHDPWMRYQLHPDHRASGTLALDAMISARDRLYFPEQIGQGLQPCRVRRALLFASDQPDFYVDITSTIDRKLKALGLHESQVGQWGNWKDRIRQRAEAAGESQGVKYAEAFKKLILT